MPMPVRHTLALLVLCLSSNFASPSSAQTPDTPEPEPTDETSTGYEAAPDDVANAAPLQAAPLDEFEAEAPPKPGSLLPSQASALQARMLDCFPPCRENFVCQAGQCVPGIAQPKTQPDCFPPCRENYLCHKQQCVSACNPVCDSDEKCIAGACILRDAAVYANLPELPATSRKRLPPRSKNEPSPPLDAGWHTHDGFLLRFGLGYGYAVTDLDMIHYYEAPYGTYAGDAIELKGGFREFHLDLGGAIVDNVVLFARLGQLVVPHANVDAHGGTTAYNRKTRELRLGTLGVGMTYYVMPSNIYFTGVLSDADLWDVDPDLSDYDYLGSDHGVMFSLEAGKEWWTGPNWGLGIGVALHYVESDDSEFKLRGAGLQATATYQ